MRLAEVGEVYTIFPVAGISHVIDFLASFFQFEQEVSCVAVTYSYSPDVIGVLHQIAPNI